MSERAIHATALIDKGAEIGAGLAIGPYCVIGPNVRIGDRCRLYSHVVVTGRTSIGEGCEIYPFASIGHNPQDKKYKGEDTSLEIGASNVIREHVTMNPGTEGGGGRTRVGSHCLFMAGAHVAHDCSVGDNVIFANCATLGGHCVVEDYVILGGLSAAHQFVRIGTHAFVGGMTGLMTDLIPFGVAVGDRASLQGLNIVGLKRRGFSREQIHNLRNAYRVLFSPEGTLMERLDDVEAMFPDDEGVRRIVAFVRERGERALCMPRASEG
jgi:UDP-N-acetylglucosamine acyltransferase